MTPTAELPRSSERDQAGPLVTTIGARWKLILFLGLIFAVAGGAAGYLRSPEYRASSDLSVGEVDLATQALQGYAAGAQNLAGVYSRLATSSVVVARAARKARIGPADLRSRVTASQVPESSVFRISTTASSGSEAVRLNRIVADTATAFIARLSDGGTQERADARAGILRASRRASLKRIESRRLVTKKGKAAEIAELNAQAARFEQDANVWALRYQQAATAKATDFKGAEVISPAVSASDDQSSWIQRLGLIGAATGVLLGIAIASGLDRRRRGGATA